ncbi:Armadillo-type fold [Pseudocohnilembus persalinus]|uniref:Armadillo-type fold n=1 Tax=Pseudocohnilembus persalinus TaxID=266149 RepID=A0A0V0QCI5_PSEPJ|nr:Armadillo-type fold [Pseudocohnilembus persalinus]|eukprot:KRW99764.1 Armadillo-type fold [Pseudocohnilembus persalinus]
MPIYEKYLSFISSNQQKSICLQQCEYYAYYGLQGILNEIDQKGLDYFFENHWNLICLAKKLQDEVYNNKNNFLQNNQQGWQLITSSQGFLKQISLTENPNHLQMLLQQLQIQNTLMKLTSGSFPSKIRQHSLFVLSNLCSNPSQYIENLFDDKIIKKLFKMASFEEIKVKYECLQCLGNLLLNSNDEQFDLLMDNGILEIMTKNLDQTDPSLPLLVVFRQNRGQGYNPYLNMFLQLQGEDLINNMLDSKNQQIQQISQNIIDEFVNYQQGQGEQIDIFKDNDNNAYEYIEIKNQNQPSLNQNRMPSGGYLDG